MNENDATLLDKFKAFVSDILSVTKEDIKKIEDEAQEAKDALREREPLDEEPC